MVCGIFLITHSLLSGRIGDAVMTSLINICIWGLIVADLLTVSRAEAQKEAENEMESHRKKYRAQH